MTMRSVCLALAAASMAGGPIDTSEGRAPPIDAPMWAAEQGETRATLVILNPVAATDARIVQKRYAPGYSDETRFISWSMAKTVTALLIGELVADGRLRLDAPAPIVEWQGANDPRRAITLRHLLQMRAGLRHTEVGEPVENSDTNQVLFVSGTGDMAARAIAQPLEARPGSKFEYSSLTSIILSEIIARTLTPSRDPRVRAAAYRAFAQERLFRPAGITSAFLDFDGAGTQVGGSLIYMTLPDWGRFGEVLRARRDIVAPEWLAFLTTSSPRSAEYGGHLWLNRPQGEGGAMYAGAPPDVFSAEGHLGQHVVVSPGQRAVVVRLGHTLDPQVETDWRGIAAVLRSLR